MLPVRLRGARTHNLRGIDLDLPPGQFVALTGPSGAGKSSLAMDTLYAEGQRRFVESFSPYARQFLERLERPPMDSLDPIAATVAVDRKAPVKSSRSTVATMTDLEPYLAALFGSDAVPVCPDCGEEAVITSPALAAERVVTAWPGARATVSYAVRAEDTAGFLELRERLAKDGYRKLLVGGEVRDIDSVKPSEATGALARVEVVIDRVAVGARDVRRLQQAIESAWERGAGRAELRSDTPVGESQAHLPVLRGLVCPKCARSFEPPRPALFSYNSPLGACEACRGFGRIIAIDWDKVFPDPKKTLASGAIRPWLGKSSEWERKVLRAYAKKVNLPMDVPWGELTDAQRAQVIEGEGTWTGGKFPGVRAWFKWLEGRTYKMHVRVLLARYREYAPCGACKTSRLNATALSYRVGDKNLADWHQLTVGEALVRARSLGGRARPLSPQGARVREALVSRLHYLDRVGLGYLTLARQARTLSGGEAQRAALTTALGAQLTGTLFVLDEPTVGLHASDIPALGEAMHDLSRAGNTVMVIEHDETIVRGADRVIELGPSAGIGGGSIVFDGAPEALARRKDVATGRAWAASREGRGAEAVARRKPTSFLAVRGAKANNLDAVDVDIPLGIVCAITGPSGSGKSTLAEDIVYRALARAFGDTTVERPGPHAGIDGASALGGVVLVDQAPLGRTARGNAATYTKAWNKIRTLFADEPEAKRRGLTPAHFSFNVAETKGKSINGAPRSGRCEACAGEGYETIEMQFLADVSLLCTVCQGKRFRPEVLAVKHRGLDVSEMLALTVDEVIQRFGKQATGESYEPAVVNALQPVALVGLGYLPLGQPLSTLSGGEAQRLKLARALSEPAKRTLFVLDEPSAGLHPEDVRHVTHAISLLVLAGASVLVVEHDLDIIAACDWIIDLGPGAGPDGGRVVARGTPDELARSGSKTGIALARHLAPAKSETRNVESRRASATASIESIEVVHASEHNLKNISCSIPHSALTVVTGPSGSGKSSLAFDVVFAEGQRRFMETLSPYARQFLPTLPRPSVDTVTGVPPSIALEQRTSRAGATSSVATVTEIAHYLRLLYAKLGEVHCPNCDTPVAPLAPDDIFNRLTARGSKGLITLYAPAVAARKGTYVEIFSNASQLGITEARVDGVRVSTAPPPKLAKTKEHSIDLIMFEGAPGKLDRGTFDQALSLGHGTLRVAQGAGNPQETVHSTARACPACGTGVPEIDPRWFSANTKQGRCDSCEGTGVRGGPEAIEAADEGAHLPPCKECEGTRLASLPRRVRLFGETYPALLARDVRSAVATVDKWAFKGDRAAIAKAAHAELSRRLSFVVDVGLGYLTLDRGAASLSGGEMQRLRLSAQLGSGLTGALYVLDEPTIGLHPRDTDALLSNLRALVATGSTVLVVEHDADTIRAADHLIELGPEGGRGGGHIVAQGKAKDVLAHPDSPTGRALTTTALVTREPRSAPDRFLELTGARAHNLKGGTLRVPVGRLVVVAGVSGSGKSTLVRKVFFPAVRRALGLVADEPGAFDTLRAVPTPSGPKPKKPELAGIRRALAVDQSPIGRTPRSVPATFLGIWDEIRKLYARLPESQMRGYAAGRFSFNTSTGGRCPTCEGQGAIVSEMAFLPDVVSPCDACGGARFEPATLDVRYAGHTIGDVLKLSAEDAAALFAAHPKIARPLETLRDLGVGYVQVGQGSNTLSGGEAQRLKLAEELTAGRAHEPTLYVLDEPTTGLHLRDVGKLVTLLDRLVVRGDTVVVIEHHPDVIAAADWVIELGPEAGASGGKIVFEGTPAALVRAATATGKYLTSAATRPRSSAQSASSTSTRRSGRKEV